MVEKSEPVPPSDWLPEPAAPSRSEPSPGPTPYGRILVTYACVVVMGMALTWAFLSMRSVAGVGGSCGSDGTSLGAPCPDGSWLIALGIPLLLISMFLGSGVGMSIGAPPTLLPMWALLFTSLGWNFLELGLTGGVDVGFVVCGVVFWAMALPAWWAMAVAFKASARRHLGLDHDARKQKPSKKERKAAETRRRMWDAGSLEGSLWWWLVFTVLGAGGALAGVATYALASA